MILIIITIRLLIVKLINNVFDKYNLLTKVDWKKIINKK